MPLPSLTNPPNAPKKVVKRKTYPIGALEQLRLSFPLKSEDERYEQWRIRPKYLTWCPRDIENISDRELLTFLHEKYAFPSSQPQNAQEEAYFAIMADKISSRLSSPL